MQPPSRERSAALELSDLYRRHGRALQRRAGKLLGGTDEAEDVLQEVFLAMVASPGLHRGEASIFTLLYQMVTHKALDRSRDRARRQHRNACLRWDNDEVGFEGGLGGIDAASDLRRMPLLSKSRTFTAARLHFVEGHTQGEVAEVLGVSRKTVVRLLKALSAQARS